jgi:RNA polymerase sigma factor (sigma-70 family)
METQAMASAMVQRHALRDLGERSDDLSDENLLELFISGEDYESQEAFRAVIVRHGPMVLGICRHVLTDQHDADDAFQATFLVLAQKASSIRNRRVLAGWLHEVAHRIAIKARASAVRRRNLERQGMAMLPPVNEPTGLDEAAAWNELRPVLHAEVNRLPDKYRLPVILSYLEGKTNEEVAELLNWPVGTVKGRLSRARGLLKSRLMRRGLCLSAAFLMAALDQRRVFAEVVPVELVKETVRMARRFGPRSAAAATASADVAPVPTSNVAAMVDSLSTAAGPHLAIGTGLAKWLLISAVVVLASVGIGVALANSGDFSSVRAAVYSLVPFGPTSAPAACH